MTISLTTVNEQALYLGQLFSRLEKITDGVVETRVNFELLAKNPRLGAPGPSTNGKPGRMVTPQDVATELSRMGEDRDLLVQLILEATATETLDDARILKSLLAGLLQRAVSMQGLQQALSVGFFSLRDEVAKLVTLDDSAPVEDQLAAALQKTVHELEVLVANLPPFAVLEADVTKAFEPSRIVLQ